MNRILITTRSVEVKVYKPVNMAYLRLLSRSHLHTAPSGFLSLSLYFRYSMLCLLLAKSATLVYILSTLRAGACVAGEITRTLKYRPLENRPT